MGDENKVTTGFCDPDRWTFIGSLLICVGGTMVSVGNLLRLNETGRLSEHAPNPKIFSEQVPVAGSGSPNSRARDYFL